MPATPRPTTTKRRDGLYVVESAPRQSPESWWPDDWVLVLVHGTLTRAAGLARLARRLPDFPVVRYDRRGYGKSAELGPGVLRDHTDDLFKVLAGRSGVVMGHSFGGVVALAAGARAPGQVRAVITYEAPTPWAPWWPTWTPDRSEATASDPAGDAAERFLRGTIGDEAWERLPERARLERRAEGASMLVEIGSLNGPPPPVDLRSVAVPVLSIHGSRTIERHAHAARDIAVTCPLGEEAVLDGGDHGAPLSKPLELAALVRRGVRRAVEHL